MTGFGLPSWLLPAIGAAVLAIGGYLLSLSISARLKTRGASPTEIRTARFVVRTIAFALATVVLFAAFGPISVASSLTVSALIGLAATLAAQTIIANLMAGYLLVRNGVLRMGDEVQISGVHGRVARLGLVTTWLRLEDGSLASVSNSTLLGGPLVNRSVGERLRGEY